MLTPQERRGAILVTALLAIGSLWDLGQALHPARRSLPAGEPGGGRVALADTAAAEAPRSSEDTPLPSLPSLPPPPGEAAVRSSARGAKPAPSRPIDLNHAAASELHRLPGIGPVLAGRIVEYRLRHGRFAAVEELLGVHGIGPRLLERIRPFVRV